MTMPITITETKLPDPDLPPARRVVLVDHEASSSALLVAYLSARGWAVQHMSSARRAIRLWGTKVDAPLLVVNLADGDPDTFELLAFAARTISGRIVVIGDLSRSEAQPLGVARVFPFPCRFADVAEALDQLDGHSFSIREVS